MLITLLLLTCASALAISFVCSLTEAVLLSLNPLALRLGAGRGLQEATRWLALKNQIERPVAAILIFNTLANTGLATLAGALFVKVGGAEWLWLFSVLMTALVLVGTELVPKILGVHHADRLAPHLIGPLTTLLRLSSPVVTVLHRLCERLKNLGPGQHAPASERIMDIITLVQSAKAEQLIHNREEIIIIHAATLSARRIRTVMVPADAVQVMHHGVGLEENLQRLGAKLHRSYPVSPDGTLAAANGRFAMREGLAERLLRGAAAQSWQDSICPLLRVQGDHSLTHLLALFLESGEKAAAVEDSQGVLVGWITLDDVMQVLMGARL